MKIVFHLLIALAALVHSPAGHAVLTVNPNGVNVRASGPTTVFLTFQGLDPGEAPVEAYWCGAVRAGVVGGAVTSFDPCEPGTLYGRLPLRHDLARISRSGSFTNLTDVMTIPATVARRAYQDAAAGQASDFYYVRRFAGGSGGDQYVVVTCRLSAAGARSPLALLDVRLRFDGAGGDAVLPVVERGATLPRFGARILYSGTGELRGRWELVQPGDAEPRDEDLLTEATLPAELRGTQRRYLPIGRFSVFLPPGGELDLPGPDARALPLAADGPYRILLRIEATDDKEGQSQTGGGRLATSGGVAGFGLPMLRFYVGAPGQGAAALHGAALGQVELLSPGVAAAVGASEPLVFSWIDVNGAAAYRIELQGDGRPLAAALVKPMVSRYTLPAPLRDTRAVEVRWRVTALDAQGRPTAQSEWRALGAWQ